MTLCTTRATVPRCVRVGCVWSRASKVCDSIRASRSDGISCAASARFLDWPSSWQVRAFAATLSSAALTPPVDCAPHSGSVQFSSRCVDVAASPASLSFLGILSLRSEVWWILARPNPSVYAVHSDLIVRIRCHRLRLVSDTSPVVWFRLFAGLETLKGSYR